MSEGNRSVKGFHDAREIRSIIDPQTTARFNTLLDSSPPLMWDTLAGEFANRLYRREENPVISTFVLWSLFQILPPRMTEYLLEDTPELPGISRIESFIPVDKRGMTQEQLVESVKLKIPTYLIHLTAGASVEDIEDLTANTVPLPLEIWKDKVIEMSIYAMADLPTYLFPPINPANMGNILLGFVNSQIKRDKLLGEMEPDLAKQMQAMFPLLNFLLSSNSAIDDRIPNELVIPKVMAFLAESPQMKNMLRLLLETSGISEQESNKDYGASIFRDEWVRNILNQAFAGSPSLLVTTAGPKFDDSDPAQNKRGGDLLIFFEGKPLVLIDVTNRKPGTRHKKISGIHAGLEVPTLVLSLESLNIHLADGYRRKIDISQYHKLLKESLHHQYDPFYRCSPEERERIIFWIIDSLISEAVGLTKLLDHQDEMILENIFPKLAKFEDELYPILEAHDVTAPDALSIRSIMN